MPIARPTVRILGSSLLVALAAGCAKPAPESPATAEHDGKTTRAATSGHEQTAPKPEGSALPEQTVDGAREALIAVCSDAPRKSTEETVCKGILFTSLSLLPEAKNSQESHDKRLSECETKNACVDASVHAYWGVRPLTKPSIDDSLRYAHKECSTLSAESEACVLENVLMRVRQHLVRTP